MRSHRNDPTDKGEVHRRPALRCLTVIGDGRRAFLFDDTGTRLRPRLALRLALKSDSNPRTAEQGAGRPGRAFQSIGRTRSAMEEMGLHEVAERGFAREVMNTLDKLYPSRLPPGLILVAPPRTLSYWRELLPQRLRAAILAEVAKDLTKFSTAEMEERLSGR
jgi:protein required for attachment to host cells